MTTAERIKTRRLMLRLSREDVAARSGLSRETVRLLEHGRHTPTTTTTVALAAALECDPADLQGD